MKGLRERSPGVWEGRVWNPNSKRQISKTIRTTRKREAEKAYLDFKREIEDKGSPSNETLEKLLWDWFEFKKSEWSPYTINGYHWRIEKHIVPELGHIPLHKLRASDLDRFYTKHRNRGLAPSSVRNYHAIIRGALEQGIKWDRLSFNPALKATPPGLDPVQIESPETADVIRVKEVAKEHSPEVLMFVHLGAKTGARRGELCALRFSSLKDGGLWIKTSIYQIGRDVGEKKTKTKQKRWVELDVDTQTYLASYKEEMEERARKVGATLDPDAFIFSLAIDGSKPWRPDYITLAFKRLCKRAGVKGVRLHDLRHFHASELIANGASIPETQYRLGHAQGSTTVNLYAHPTKEGSSRVAKIAGELLK